MNVGKAIRKAVAREVAPLLSDCERIRAEIDHAEDCLTRISDRHERAAARVQLILRRAKLAAVLSELRGTEDHVLRLAKERWPSWRI
jgi:hypothetical protein